ncbi:MAG: hypothetical protein HFJ52_01465 [Clostridia bacterium]|jgi:hypothetical protein|nr:hypothetical protein [Clostridia bacterium]
MAYDHETQIKFTNTKIKLRDLNSAFLSQLTSADLRTLLDLVISAETNIREELKNCAGRNGRK